VASESFFESCIVDHSRSGVACEGKDGGSLLILGFLLLCSGLVLLGQSLVLFLDLRELSHVLKEVGRSLQGDQQLGLLAALSSGVCPLALAGYGNGHGADRLELSILVPDQVLRGNDAGGDGISESVQLDGLMDLQVAFAEKDVEVRVFLDRDIDLTRVLRARVSWRCGLDLGLIFVLASSGLSFHTLFVDV